MNSSLKELQENINDKLKAFQPRYKELETLLNDIPDNFIDLYPYNKIDWESDTIHTVLSKANKLSELWKRKDSAVI